MGVTLLFVDVFLWPLATTRTTPRWLAIKACFFLVACCFLAACCACLSSKLSRPPAPRSPMPTHFRFGLCAPQVLRVFEKMSQLFPQAAGAGALPTMPPGMGMPPTQQ